MECWKACTMIECFFHLNIIMLKHMNTENKVNSLILDYEIVLDLHVYFRKVALSVNCKHLVQVASSLYNQCIKSFYRMSID